MARRTPGHPEGGPGRGADVAPHERADARARRTPGPANESRVHERHGTGVYQPPSGAGKVCWVRPVPTHAHDLFGLLCRSRLISAIPPKPIQRFDTSGSIGLLILDILPSLLLREVEASPFEHERGPPEDPPAVSANGHEGGGANARARVGTASGGLHAESRSSSSSRRHPLGRSSRQHRNPIALAQERQRALDDGEWPSRAALARQLGVCRVRVTQVLGLLELAPKVVHAIAVLGNSLPRSIVSERPLFTLPTVEQQRALERVCPMANPASA